jgi:hypothetical protein
LTMPKATGVLTSCGTCSSDGNRTVAFWPAMHYRWLHNILPMHALTTQTFGPKGKLMG